MSLVALGANYKTAPIDLLERISLTGARAEKALREVIESEGIRGVVVLSTCNRVEIYVDSITDRHGATALEGVFSRCLHGKGVEECSEGLPQGFYLERGEDTVRHLFRVICSLDSQVLGEAQILGQVRAAFMRSSELGYCSETLTKLFKDALHVGKRVRTETAIGGDSVSLSTTAFKAAANEFDDITGCQVLFVGSGEMAALTLDYLQDAGVCDYLVTSRTRQHAEELGRLCDARVFDFAERHAAAAKADVVFCMTSSEEPVMRADELQAARRAAGTAKRKLVMIDLAVPRDVQTSCTNLQGVVLYDMEALSSVIDEGMSKRMAAVGSVERLVAEAEEGFLEWLQQRSVEPTIRELYSKFSAAVDAEVGKAAKALEALHGRPLEKDELKILEASATSVMKKILHGPTARLRRESQTADSYYYTSAARYLFGLDSFPAGCVPHDCADKPCLVRGDCPKGLELPHNGLGRGHAR